MTTPISRRTVLAGATGAAAAVPAPPFAAAAADVAADVIVVGAGLSGLVAAAELAEAGRRVLVLDQEPQQSLGGQAFWSFAGLFLIDSPEQRANGVKDSLDLARQDWAGTAGFDRGVDDPRGQDYWGSRWAQAYLNFAAGRSGPGCPSRG